MAKSGDQQLQTKEIALKGKWVSSQPGVTLGDNFKQLVNLRYTDTHPKGVLGMTAVNTTPLTAYRNIRNGFHFTKDVPPESHLLVQGWKPDGTESRIFQNTTAIPSVGDFSADSLYTDTVADCLGRFSAAPNGSMAYCNGEKSLIWGGDEFEVGAVLNYAPDSSFSYDYTDVLRNTLDDAENVATLYEYTDTSESAASVLLLHFENNLTDSSATTPHTPTGTAITYSAIAKKFGSYSAIFNGTSSKISIPDDADFDFSGGKFTADFWMQRASCVASEPCFYQEGATANDYIKLSIENDESVKFVVSHDTAGSEVVDIEMQAPMDSLGTGSIDDTKWIHIAVVENDNQWNLYVGGKNKAQVTSAARTQNYTGAFLIGNDDATAFWTGKMDEFRVVKAAAWTGEFDPPTAAYAGTATTETIASLYVGGPRPISGIKCYVKTANTSAAVMSVDYWDGEGWSAVTTLSDGTDDAGVSLAATGWVTFDSTVLVAKITVIKGIVLYWYRIKIPGVDTTTQLSQMTLTAPFQTVKDIWDGVDRSISSFQRNTGDYAEFTLNVRDNEYNSYDTGTYCELGALVADTQYVVAGFSERMCGVGINIASDKLNTTADTEVQVYYWNGSAWIAVSGLNDGTKKGGKSLSTSGIISWSPVGDNIEFKQEISRTIELYYYKMVWNKTLGGDPQLFYVWGIPTPKTIRPFKFPLYALNRVWLCNATKEKPNRVVCSNEYTCDVWNGEDTVELEIGDEKGVIAATSLYSQFGSSLFNILVFLKEDEVWILTGATRDAWTVYKVSDNVGCVAPLSLVTISLPSDVLPGANRHVAIWQGANGIYMFDGKGVTPIHDDIRDWFDISNSYSIERDHIGKSIGFYDEANYEYHWCFVSSGNTNLTHEFVYDLKRSRWFRIYRGTSNHLQYGLTVKDTSGNVYCYGATIDGSIQRLEYGTTFAGSTIDHTMETGDFAIAGIMNATNLRHIRLVALQKATGSITTTHYGNTKDTASVLGSATMSQAHAGYELAYPIKNENLVECFYHRLKFEISTSTETVGFEPLFLGVLYKVTDMPTQV